MSASTNRSPYSLEVGDRVWLTSQTGLNLAGDMATVVAKDTTQECSAAWSITVQFDGRQYYTVYPYPGCPVRRFEGGTMPELLAAVA